MQYKCVFRSTSVPVIPVIAISQILHYWQLCELRYPLFRLLSDEWKRDNDTRIGTCFIFIKALTQSRQGYSHQTLVHGWYTGQWQFSLFPAASRHVTKATIFAYITVHSSRSSQGQNTSSQNLYSRRLKSKHNYIIFFLFYFVLFCSMPRYLW